MHRFTQKERQSLNALMLNKFIRYAIKLGIDPDEFMEMTVFDAVLRVQEIQEMWQQLAKDTK